MRQFSKIVLCLCLLVMLVLPAAAQNTDPVALPDTFSMGLGGMSDIVPIPMDKLLSNDSSNTGTKTLVSVGVSAQGVTPTINAAMAQVWYPVSSLLGVSGASFSGTYRDTFSYTMTDGTFTSSSYVTITLHNSAPEASDVVLQTVGTGESRTSFSVLLDGSFTDGNDCDDSDESACSHSMTIDSPPECGSVSSTIDGLVFTANDGTGASCPSGLYLIGYHVTDPWGASSNTAFFKVVHEATVGYVISTNGSFSTVVKDPVSKKWLPANFKFSGPLFEQNKVKVVQNPLYQESGNAGDNPLYCGKTDHLRVTRADTVNRRVCTCPSGYYVGASCGLQITNVQGGTLKIVQTMPPVSLTNEDVLSFSFVINSHTMPASSRVTMSAKVSVVGTDTVFTCTGEQLLGHELSHVVQQCTRSGSEIPGGAPLSLKATVTYKTGMGSGKVSLQDFHFVVGGNVGFSRPGDISSPPSGTGVLPLPPQ